MALSEEVAQSIDDLPEEAQSILMDFIADLKARYSNNSQEGPASEKTPYEAFQESGLIGCISIGDGLSANYKEVLAEELNEKYDRR